MQNGSSSRHIPSTRALRHKPLSSQDGRSNNNYPTGDRHDCRHGRAAAEKPGAAQPPFRFDDLERFPVPRRRHRDRDLRQVRDHLDAADRRPADLRRRPRTCRWPRCRPGSTCGCRRRRSSCAAVEAQTHRRFIKTHLPVDALVFSQKAKYIYIGRDGRDVVWSMYNHHKNANAMWYAALNDTPGLVGPIRSGPRPSPSSQYFRDWLERTAIRSGRSGTTCAPGGRSATCRTCT